MSTHIEAGKNDIAKIVLMPGDPLRAKMIAETYLDDAKLVNRVRNMLAYTGYYKISASQLWEVAWVCQAWEFMPMNCSQNMM